MSEKNGAFLGVPMDPFWRPSFWKPLFKSQPRSRKPGLVPSTIQHNTVGYPTPHDMSTCSWWKCQGNSAQLLVPHVFDSFDKQPIPAGRHPSEVSNARCRRSTQSPSLQQDSFNQAGLSIRLVLIQGCMKSTNGHPTRPEATKMHALCYT